MGPKNQYTAQPRDFDESDIERTDEYQQFLEDIKTLHEGRGSLSFHNPEPDIQRKKIDLLKLYKKVTEHGGYTKVSEQTGLWKELAVEFNPPQHNSNIGFVLKSIYKNNLGAWECKQLWNKEPPPKEALEELTAAGSELLGRKAPEMTESPGAGLSTRGRSSGAGGGSVGDSPAAGPTTTPSGRTLREAPPKRQFFQPEINTPKQRSVSSIQTPPSSSFPTINGKPATMNNSNNNNQLPSGTGQNPSNLMPPMPKLVVTAVETPYSNPAILASLRADNIHTVPSGLSGPGHHRRLLDVSVLRMASGIPEEVNEGLKFLLAASCVDEGTVLYDKLPLLTDECIEMLGKGLNTIRPVNDVNGLLKPWNPNAYDPKPKVDLATFNTLTPTLETKEWREKMDPSLIAALILRNLTIDNDENADHLVLMVKRSVHTLMRGCYLPTPVFADLRINCLEILTAMAKFIKIRKYPELLDMLWDRVLSDDRHTLILALVAITRLAVRDDRENISLVPPEVLQRIINLTMIEDTELLAACLDFLYSYTLIEENAVKFVEGIHGVDNISQLTRLLSYGATKFYPNRSIAQKAKPPKKDLPEMIPELPKDLVQEFASLSEPQRAVVWMRGCFEPNAESEITQIALWQSYQVRFAAHINSGPRPQTLLHANDFIKNVNVAFKTAHAMMLPAQGQQPQRFVIRGIAPRETPMAADGTIYLKCEWRVAKPTIDSKTGAVLDPSATVACGQFFKDFVALGTHVRDKHTFLKKDSELKEQRCEWKACPAFHEQPTQDKIKFFNHILGHVRPWIPKLTAEKDPKAQSPATPGTAEGKQAAPPKKPEETVNVPWYTEITDVDKKGLPAGIPYMASRVLVNLSKAKTQVSVDRLTLLKRALFQKAADNPVLREAIFDVIIEMQISEESLADIGDEVILG